MKISKRYSSLAKYYDFIYKDKDYRSDANFVKKLISKYKKSSGNHLLEVACGTGRFLEFFQDSFVCTGLDNSREMLRLAKKKNLKAKLVLEDMVNFCLSEQYDVVLCLFGSISLVLNQENLQKTLSRLVAATKLGGLLVIEPFFSQQTYAQRKTPKVAVSANDSIL